MSPGDLGFDKCIEAEDGAIDMRLGGEMHDSTDLAKRGAEHGITCYRNLSVMGTHVVQAYFDFPGDFLITCGRSNGSFAQGLPDALQIPSRLPREVEALRRCIDWLQRLERGENVIVNLRLDTDVETEYSLLPLERD